MRSISAVCLIFFFLFHFTWLAKRKTDTNAVNDRKSACKTGHHHHTSAAATTLRRNEKQPPKTRARNTSSRNSFECQWSRLERIESVFPRTTHIHIHARAHTHIHNNCARINTTSDIYRKTVGREKRFPSVLRTGWTRRFTLLTDKHRKRAHGIRTAGNQSRTFKARPGRVSHTCALILSVHLILPAHVRVDTLV